jgi:hypothetical protein
LSDLNYSALSVLTTGCVLEALGLVPSDEPEDAQGVPERGLLALLLSIAVNFL